MPEEAHVQDVKPDLPDLQLLRGPTSSREVYGNCQGQHLGSSGLDNREENASQHLSGSTRGQAEKGSASPSPLFSLFLGLL